MIVIESRRKSLATIGRNWPGSCIIDVTSKGPEPWVQFSPFYPHGGIPIPNSPGEFGESVEGIWQGLKVFEHAGIDSKKWSITSMKGIKRTSKTLGRVLGHELGIGGKLIGYRDARLQIYLPTYRWVLENRLTKQIEQLQKLGAVVLLDYETNGDVDDLLKPLSHASLVKAFIEGTWPA